MAEEGVPPAGLELMGPDEDEEVKSAWSPPKTLPHITNWVRAAHHSLKLCSTMRQRLACQMLRLERFGMRADHNHAQKPAVMQRRRRGSILRSMSKQMEERVALLGLAKAGKTTLVEQLAHADPIRITNPPTTPHAGTLHTHNPTDNMMMVRLSPIGRYARADLTRQHAHASDDLGYVRRGEGAPRHVVGSVYHGLVDHVCHRLLQSSVDARSP